MPNSQGEGGTMERSSLTEAAITRQVAAFYEKARIDPLLGPIFAAAIRDWPPHIQEISDFWASVLLGIRRYKGNPMAAHAKHPLTSAMFDRWLALWEMTAEEVFNTETAAIVSARAQMIGSSLKAGLFFRPTRTTSASMVHPH
jgi:hemoglobin